MAETVLLQGLTGAEAAERLRKYGLNTVPEKRPNPMLVFLGKFWASVPWMLEATVALQLALGKSGEAIIIAALLLFNSILSFFQERQSNKALVLLRKRLSIQTRVLRDGAWRLLPAEELVPSDIAHLRLGDIVLRNLLEECICNLPLEFIQGSLQISPQDCSVYAAPQTVGYVSYAAQ